MEDRNSDIASSREHGEQPLKAVIQELGLSPHDLVAASKEHLTHKQVSKGCRGRELTRRTQHKIVNALNSLCEDREFALRDLFTY